MCPLYSSLQLFLRYHFTTGKFPFEGENVYKLFGVISTGVFQIPHDLSPLLKDLLKGTVAMETPISTVVDTIGTLIMRRL